MNAARVVAGDVAARGFAGGNDEFDPARDDGGSVFVVGQLSRGDSILLAVGHGVGPWFRVGRRAYQEADADVRIVGSVRLYRMGSVLIDWGTDPTTRYRVDRGTWLPLDDRYRVDQGTWLPRRRLFDRPRAHEGAARRANEAAESRSKSSPIIPPASSRDASRYSPASGGGVPTIQGTPSVSGGGGASQGGRRRPRRLALTARPR